MYLIYKVLTLDFKLSSRIKLFMCIKKYVLMKMTFRFLTLALTVNFDEPYRNVQIIYFNTIWVYDRYIEFVFGNLNMFKFHVLVVLKSSKTILTSTRNCCITSVFRSIQWWTDCILNMYFHKFSKNWRYNCGTLG